MKYDVIIVGAGPGGIFAAYELMQCKPEWKVAVFEAGHALGIVGHTGAGKSTLANLLIRLYDVTAGEILIDGINVKDISFAELRKHVAIVSQETYLFNGTIMENRQR